MIVGRCNNCGQISNFIPIYVGDEIESIECAECGKKERSLGSEQIVTLSSAKRAVRKYWIYLIIVLMPTIGIVSSLSWYSFNSFYDSINLYFDGKSTIAKVVKTEYKGKQSKGGRRNRRIVDVYKNFITFDNISTEFTTERKPLPIGGKFFLIYLPSDPDIQKRDVTKDDGFWKIVDWKMAAFGFGIIIIAYLWPMSGLLASLNENKKAIRLYSNTILSG